MPRIDIPSLNTSTAPPELRRESDVDGTEFAPVLLTQLRDDLARARLREAFWISLVAHLVALILLALSPKFLPSLRPVELRTAEQMINDKDLTYLELPHDAQHAPAKAPKTKFLSDKNRIASSRVPTPNRKVLDSLRKSLPGPPGPSVPPTSASPASPAANAHAQAPSTSPQQTSNSASQFSGSVSRSTPQKSLSALGGNLSAGTAIQQAARNSARAGYSGGGGGDYGLPTGGGGKVGTGIDVLSDTMGVDFGPYLSRVLQAVRMHWYNLIPEEARPPLLKRGKVAIEFVILPDGKVAGMRLIGESGDIALDRAAWGGITASNPFSPLPSEFHGPYLALRFRFLYNPDRRELE